MLNWGILGVGNIARRFMESLEHSEQGHLYAVASYTLKDKETFINNGIIVYDDYHKLICDENVDCIYVATRHADHYRWVKEALLHNKAVLCEKPATLTYDEMKELCDLAKTKHTFFLEGLKTRFVPMANVIKETVDKGTIGKVLRVENSFCYECPYIEGKYLFDEKQGGILYDVGTYNIGTLYDYIDSEVTHIHIHCEKKYGVDAYDEVEITFASGQSAKIEMALDRKKERLMTIYGEYGKITCNPFYRPVSGTVEFDNGESFSATKDYVYDDFFGEIEETHRCVGYLYNESPRYTHEHMCKTIALIEKIKEMIDHGESDWDNGINCSR